MKRIALLLLVSFLISQDSYIDSLKIKNPSLAWKVSLVPGMGQIYNEQYLQYDDCINSSNQTDNCSAYAEAALEKWGIDDFSDFKYLWSTNLTNVDFTGSNLSYSDFSYSDITGANLKDADLTGAIWYYTICPDGTNSGKTGSCSAT